ncbi:hypothetical protein JCM24511_08788 [Saitozyma sp. JCM 24511]|nr:hypothetical protein JCM24511_08788 [Saitozyma sp. JCM 24511]
MKSQLSRNALAIARRHRAVPSLARAQSTTSDPSPSSWTPALPAGTSRAYDEALSYLTSYQSRSLARLESLRKLPSSPETSAEIDRLEVEAYVNDPATRRTFRETDGRGHMDKSVMRHLAEQRWKRQGGLDLLMQRVHQLNVVPDLLPDLPSTCPLTLSTTSTSTTPSAVEPGSIQSSSAFASPPRLTLQLFDHPSTSSSEGHFTLLVVDPDSPSPETQSFSQRVHYAKVDIPLSVLSGEVDLFDQSLGKEVLCWEPPAPAQGSGKHRFVFLVLRQTSSAPTREGFDLRSYLSSEGRSAADVVGITLVRSQWTKDDEQYISDTYRNFRGVEAPVYGKPPKEMKYGYPLSAKAVQADEIRREAWDNAVAELESVVGEPRV